MEPITVEQAREMRNDALKKKKEERFKQVQTYGYFDTVMKDIEKAANDGKNNVDFYPHISDFYDEIIQSGGVVPAKEKDFSNHEKEIFKALEESLGYKITRNDKRKGHKCSNHTCSSSFRKRFLSEFPRVSGTIRP